MEPKITRKMLYDLVWSTPMTKLADRYGISDVALRNKFDRLTGGHDWRHCIRQRNLPRLLRMLQGLFLALESRGHEIKVVATSPHSSERDVQLVIHGRVLDLRFEERLKKKERPLTKQEKDEFKSRSEWNVRFGRPPPKETKRWVQYPDDELVLRTSGHWQYRGPQGWADSKHHKLEEMLGDVILGLEAIARFELEKEAELRREAEERLTRERARLRPERMKKYEQLLTENLHEMAENWTKAKQLRAFLDECQSRLPDEPLAQDWLRACREYAEHYDPFRDLTKVPKTLSPSDELLEDVLPSSKT